jgi:hypothetical protein
MDTRTYRMCARNYLLDVSNDEGYIDIREGSFAHKMLTKLLSDVYADGVAAGKREQEMIDSCEALGAIPGAFDE